MTHRQQPLPLLAAIVCLSTVLGSAPARAEPPSAPAASAPLAPVSAAHAPSGDVPVEPVASAPAASASVTAESPIPAPAGASDPVARDFNQVCSGCHTIGEGAARGPDLSGVAAWPAAQLTLAVRSMERRVGPLAPARVEALVTLLQDPNVRARLAQAKAQLARAADKPTETPDSLLGGALFFGKAPLERGGMACNACHRFHGEGGDLAPDLTHFADRSELESLAGTIARAQFPVMRAAYATHPIEMGESRHIAAFLLHARFDRKSPALDNTIWWGLGLGIGAFLLALILIARRPRGARAELLQRAAKR